MKYINHHSLNNECVRVYMCVCFDDTERIRAVYILPVKEFNSKCSCMCVSIEHFKRRNDMQLWRRLGAIE